MSIDITAVVLTYNEAPNIRRCLESIKGFCKIYVVDSGSTDQTVAICQEYTDQIHVHAYTNHASQWQWALDNLPIKTTWVLALDADFQVSDALKEALRERLQGVADQVDGIYVRHRYVFGGATIRFGGTKHYWLRIVRHGKSRADLSDLVDFRFLVEGKTIEWNASVVEYNRHDDDISTWLLKQDKFAVRLAVEEELRRAAMLHWERNPRFFGNADERIMWLRDRWLRLPLFLRPVAYFVYRYLLALGFLDGRGGFLYHVLQGFWLRTVVDWKIWQLRQLQLSSNELHRFRDQMLQTRDGSVVRIHQAMQDAASTPAPISERTAS